MKKISLLLLIWSALFMQIAMAEPAVDEDIEVKVKIAGESVTVDLSLVVQATRQEVWSVLTDFGHMADFVSNLKESRVISTSGNTLKIFQRGVATYGPINFPFESTREIRLTPFDKIKSHMISGNMRRMEGMTRLIDEGGTDSDHLSYRYHPRGLGTPLSRESFYRARNPGTIQGDEG
jgi:Polyketide cyclase / dehydrase and lipid transport